MATKPVEIPSFGVEFPPDWPLIRRHFYCALKNYGYGSAYHRLEIIKILWPDNFELHAWNRRRMESVCVSNWNTWTGPGGCGKSTDAAVFALEWWLEAPHASAVIVCSTSVKMLKKRIWAQVAHYHQTLVKRLGPKAWLDAGELIDSDTIIRHKKGDQKNGIFGMAVEEGSPEEVINNLIGIHTHRVWLILDELQGVEEVILRATRNMGKNPVFKFLGMGNPESFNDPLGRLSTPVGGWESVERAVTEHWEIKAGPVKGKGRCDFFDGRQSPAVLDLEFSKRNPWMINQDQIDNDLRSVDGNENDPSYCSQTVGWWPSMGVESTVLDTMIIEKFHCRDKAVWTQGFTRFASLDPAFEGGDQKILQFGRRGEVSDENGRHWVVQFDEWLDVPIDASIKEPIHFQIMTYVRSACRIKGIPPDEFALDSTGEGGGLKAIIDQHWGAVIGVEFGGNPSERPVNDFEIPGEQTKTCREMYNRRSCELNMAVRSFAMGNGIRGLPLEAEDQFCKRKTYLKNRKYHVEPKSEMKKRIRGKSPDNADACAIGVELCRQKGAVASVGQAVEKVSEDWAREVKRADEDFSSDNYLTGSDYQEDIYQVM